MAQNPNPIPTYFNPEIGPQYRGLSFEDVANSFNNGQQFSNQIQEQQQKGLLSRLLAQSTGQDGKIDLNKALETVQSNPNQAYQPALVNTLSGLIQQQKANEIKAQQDALKFQADNAKTVAETSGKQLDNTQKGQTLLSNLIATSIDATDAAKKLTTLGQQYGLPKDVIDSTLNALNGLAKSNQGTPEAFQNFKKSYGLLGAEKPIEYLMPNANTVANNETSIANNVLTNQTSRYNNQATVNATLSGQQTQKEIADANRKQQSHKFVQTVTAPDGKVYGVYADGSADLITDKSTGAAIQEQKKKPKLDSSALKQVNEYNTQLTQAKANQIQIGGLLQDLQSGRLVLSPQAIIAAEGRARLGQSTPNDLAIGRFNTALNQSINDILMMAKGTQTEGDANRAAQVIRANPPRDNAAALQTLQNLALIAKTNINAIDNNLNTIYANFGMERPQTQKTVQPRTQLTQEPSKATSFKGSTMSRNDVIQGAKQAGVTPEQFASFLQQQGVTIQ